MTSKEADLTMALPQSEAICASVSQEAIVITRRRCRQRPLGPAPFASFEDLSDELDSPPETARIPLPGIKEDPASQITSPSTPHTLVMGVSLTEKEDQGLKEALSGSLDTPAPPRIDISRASSSSQHEDSVTSSPDREGGNQNLGYKEDGTVDLRSSTEELDYIQEPGTVEESEAKRKREKMMKKQQQLKHDFSETQSEIDIKERKDSSCSVMSEVGLLCISGRTSRLSSIGSVASGGSAASGMSHLSTGSHMSGRSTRSPSPHKMLLETSFCGSKPAQNQTIEAEAAPVLVSHVEKQASRPPSRLCSRSPSPHRMLLETSFCGTKQIIPPAAAEITVDTKAEKAKKKKRIVSAPQPEKETVASNLEATVNSVVKKENIIVPDAPLEETKMATVVNEVVHKAKKAKPVNLPRIPDKKMHSKPKKVISIRDIPADEIYIPLKGPEVDFEEIIRKASPNLQRKADKPPSSENVIFIPLHSPTEGTVEKDSTDVTSAFKQNFDDGIYIPLHSPPKSPKSTDVKQTSRTSREISQKVEKSQVHGLTRKPLHKHQIKSDGDWKAKYEVCEDGSIYIPLHSPDEENRPIRNFEEEIRRVDEELQRAREIAEKRLLGDDKQLKPVTLDIYDPGVNRQSLPASKQDTIAGGSRTPSPGSSLSRKSSFASIFRRSDASGSPDSSVGSAVKKKTGTLTNIIRDASDGLRDRGRSRSKSREHQSPSTIVRSPSIKKNVFTNLFGKKKGDEKGISGKAVDEVPTRHDVQFNITSEWDKGLSDEGDYIIIPLRDPSDPSPALDDVEPEPAQLQENTLPSPVVVLERIDTPRSSKKSRESYVEGGSAGVEVSKFMPGRSDTEAEVLVDEKKVAKDLVEDGVTGNIHSSSSKVLLNNTDGTRVNNDLEHHSRCELEKGMEGEGQVDCFKGICQEEDIKEKESEIYGKSDKEEASRFLDSRVADLDLRHENSLDIEHTVKEEMMAVSTDGVRKLKLPPEPGDLEDDHERKGLVLQESFDDELPYVPTTLPLERSVGVPIVPIKQRVAEIKTCPIERPRSTTPINPSTLEDYVSIREPLRVSAEEKMKISLPREDSISGKSKSPRRFSAKGKTWFEFAEAVSQSPRELRKSSLTTTPSPPPLPPRSSPPTTVGLSTSAPQATSSWINFEELPEKRKQPKRITTVPSIRSTTDGGTASDKPGGSTGGNVIYSYVSPEDCQCECHDHKVHSSRSQAKETNNSRGIKGRFKVKIDSNGELMRERYATEKKFIETQGDNDILVKNECQDCESGRHEDAEEDIEKKPLLEYNSDGENDDPAVHRKEADWEISVPGVRLEVDGQSFLSDSSYECVSQDAGSMAGLDGETWRAGMKPFEMDFDVKSNRSSIISQEDLMSPEEVSGGLPP